MKHITNENLQFNHPEPKDIIIVSHLMDALVHDINNDKLNDAWWDLPGNELEKRINENDDVYQHIYVNTDKQKLYNVLCEAGFVATIDILQEIDIDKYFPLKEQHQPAN